MATGIRAQAWMYCAGALAGALLAWVLRRPSSQAADEAAQGSAPAGPGPARVVVTDAQVEAAKMIVEHDRARGRETAAPIRKIAEAAPDPDRRAACRQRLLRKTEASA